ncbi:MAG TPA: 4Fe-4S dicluster domain-containing protein, partial [Candidatus Nanopelagicales bacterium]|nr:4Fe-4S dicluster domain-containing protein [Candidatus Nanopelagicales bacterium]
SLYLGLYENETAADCRWFVPATHYLEAWGDARAWDGTVSTVQPLIRPLFEGRTATELLSVFAGERFPDARELLREAFRRRYQGADFDTFWAATLRRGLIEGSALPRVDAEIDEARLAGAITALAAAPRPAPWDAAVKNPGDVVVEASFLADPCVYDGRFANNAWLQELPKPITKLTWDNAALMSPTLARRLGVESEEVVELEIAGRRLRMPALIAPGHADGAVTLHLGYGRRGTEQLALGVGFDTYQLRLGGAPFVPGLVVRRADAPRYPLALTQQHWQLHGRPIALATTLPYYREHPHFTEPLKGPLPSLLPEVKTPLDNPSGEQWAMTIDTSICTGCSSCVVACQAENNIMVVGKEGVKKSREMHWLRIDSYHGGLPEVPEVVHQPMLCQHCEKAPCEYVCPVNATVHSPDGLNEMIYNRCVGTRFCSNNCPYKVRRFNFFDYPDRVPVNDGLVRLQRNPMVTVRERGVMEKCTYCVQRIRRSDMQARIEGRSIRPGEVVTACQQACPTEAIQFGSLLHRETPMVEWREQPRSYSVLHELGTRPRTMYLARINNPNPEIT